MSIYPMLSQHATVTNFNCKGQKQITEGMYYLFLDWLTLGILNCRMIDSKNYIYYDLELTVVGCKRSKYKELHQQYMAEHTKLHNDELRVSTFKTSKLNKYIYPFALLRNDTTSYIGRNA